MNRIYWSKDKITMLTDHLAAEKHSHLMLQLFLSLEGSMEIEVAGKKISCKGILINKNVFHAFHAREKVHLSVLIEPASSLAEQLDKKLKGKACLFLEETEIDVLQKQAVEMIENEDLLVYHKFMERLYQHMDVFISQKQYDERIRQLFLLLDSCICDDHRISAFAEKVALSPSRLSHLFREQAGVSLKSYILLHQMENAFTELLKGATITQAAMKAGFDSPSHFAATVKRMMGMPASLSLKDSHFLKVHSVEML